MKLSVRTRGILGASLALAVMLPPVGSWLEARMWAHMLVQMPLLLLSGALLAPAVPRPPWARRWNAAGVPALLAASLVLAFWMVPIAVDHAVASAGWDAVKGVSLLAAGGLVAACWREAPGAVQIFFAGNMVWMGLAVAQLYQADGPRLCNAYLQGDQTATGIGMTALVIAAAALWLIRLTSTSHAHPRNTTPTPTEAAHEA
jgi:hypothetical protein